MLQKTNKSDSTKVSKKSRNNRLRLVIQAFFAALCNGYVKGFAQGRIFDGKTKYVCVPGMNCYSCPAAVGACPIGSLQATLAGRDYKLSMYVIGLLVLFGVFFGRFVCGFLCPFGLVQDLLNRFGNFCFRTGLPLKIPFVRKIRLVGGRRLGAMHGEKFLRCLRFVFLAVFVVLLPLFVIDITGLGEPWFCKWVCPVGTLEGGIPLVLLNSAMRGAAGFLFKWKLLILAFTLFFSVVVYRPFCRYICPLGALYGIFNKISFYRLKVDESKCTRCGACESACKLSVPVFKNPDSMDCIRCGECESACPHGAIKLGFF